MSESRSCSGCRGRKARTLERRDFLKLGLTGAALSWLGSSCDKKSEPAPAPQNNEVYELTDGRTLFDDFDGHGCLMAYNNQNMAEAGRLSSQLWDSSEGAEVVHDPGGSGLLTVVDEHGKPFVHIPGTPDDSSRKLFWTGTRDGQLDTGNGVLDITKGRIYGSAEIMPSADRGWVLKEMSSLTHLQGCLLTNPRQIAFADFGTLSADIMVPSAATARSFYASLDYHTTIPEQPPGKSWVSDIGLHKLSDGELYLFAQCANVNAGNNIYLRLGQARFDTWYNVRQDIVTRQRDPTLKANEFRIEYYVDGILRETEFPPDSELLLDPSRTGWGPNRLLITFVLEAGGDAVVYFDNVRGVYRNRIK